MVSISKKEARKASKGKVVAATSIPTPKGSAKKATPAAPAAEASDEEESEWESENEDEENGGISEKGMQRLMALVNEQDLDDLEKAQLVEEDVEEDESDDEEVSGEDDEELDEEFSELDVEDDDEEEDEEMDAPVDDSVLLEEADEDAIAIDDLGSDISLDDDAVPVRKVTANNKVSLRADVGVHKADR